MKVLASLPRIGFLLALILVHDAIADVAAENVQEGGDLRFFRIRSWFLYLF
jgi:hypothetical protein